MGYNVTLYLSTFNMAPLCTSAEGSCSNRFLKGECIKTQSDNHGVKKKGNKQVPIKKTPDESKESGFPYYTVSSHAKRREK